MYEGMCIVTCICFVDVRVHWRVCMCMYAADPSDSIHTVNLHLHLCPCVQSLTCRIRPCTGQISCLSSAPISHRFRGCKGSTSGVCFDGLVSRLALSIQYERGVSLSH